MSKEMSKVFEAFGFPNVNISINKMQSPQRNTQIQKVKKAKTETYPELKHEVKEILEPETKVTEKPGYLKIVVKLPDVKKVSDIKIRKFSESLEIRAYFKDKMYFKVVPIIENSKIIENKFANEMLKIELAQTR